MKRLLRFLPAIIALSFSGAVDTDACTNVLVTPGASSDGSSIISYAADSHWLYGELYFHPAASYRSGSTVFIREWDTCRPMGSISQAPRTYQTVGNMNEHQLIITETTWGGRLELMDTTGIMDYGSIIYTTLQRARTARGAISTIVELANTYGYPSEGETFSIADTREVWIMDLIGKGSSGDKGIVWVARRVPDGFITAHANQCRITRFPQDDPENCIFAPDVISFARSKGYFSGEDRDFSFREAYCPLDAGTIRGCDSRVWSAFNILCDGKFDDGRSTAPSSNWLDYAMGYDIKGELPLWVKPSRKISPKDVADVMRDHYEGTPMDMTTDIGAGGNALPYRWRPMDFKREGKTYTNERAIATQQTGFWLVAQARAQYPDVIGALLWFGCDDAATSYLTPIYVNTSKVPECLREGNGDLLHYSATSQFWMCNRVAQACYKMYNHMAPVAREAADKFENAQMFSEVPAMDARMMVIYGKRGDCPALRKAITAYTVDTAREQFAAWTSLEELLLVKFIDGNVKAQDADGNFSHVKYSDGIPAGLTQPGYTDKWKEAVVRDHGDVIEIRQFYP